MRLLLDHVLRDDQGQDLIEYTLLIGFILFTVIGIVWSMGGSIAGVTSTTNSNLRTANIAAS